MPTSPKSARRGRAARELVAAGDTALGDGDARATEKDDAAFTDLLNSCGMSISVVSILQVAGGSGTLYCLWMS